ncbi:hydroxymethylbilane synthase [Candidatus Methylomirabilis sp.]|uniref:Porphobilinogen deaminase n=1 Tax=Candidatus Methylomirabilis tolerans TaxID=3123416 RepID=A0AAJ1AGS1_9BACT|nr:hydroxymethylbilane synthase [Candidatus Methylomirabilis sp.]
MDTDSIKLGTRGSPLALCQARLVSEDLSRQWPGLTVTIIPIKTSGDKFLDVALSQVGGKGLFVKEIEEALLDHRIDLAVHSMKDLPAELAPSLRVGAVTQREDPLDALVARHGLQFTELPRGARIGTSSLRRQVQLLHRRPDLQIVPLRGNVQTRLNKLETLDLEAVVLAAAGLIRLSLQDRITECLQPDVCLPAIGQGALAIEIREDDQRVAELVETLNHRETRQATMAERAFLRRLGGSCVTPIAAFGQIEGEALVLTGMVAGLDGKRLIKHVIRGEADAPEQAGQALAEALLTAGAGEILREIETQLREKRI